MTTLLDRERDRLNRRIRILDKDTARGLKHYRNRISKHSAVMARNRGFVFVPRGQSGFMEGVDVIALCHVYLDERHIPEDPGPDHPSKSHST